MLPTISSYLKHSSPPLLVKMLRSVIRKIVEAFNKASLLFGVIEIVELVRNTDWSDPTVIAASFIIATFTLLVSPYIVPLLASPWQTILALHFKWGAR